MEEELNYIQEISLDYIIEILKGPTKEEIIYKNQHAVIALNNFHSDSKTVWTFSLDNVYTNYLLIWDSQFSTTTAKEKTEIVNHGAVAIAYLVMSCIRGYKYVEQTEIGTGVDYRFRFEEPEDEELNFIDDFHYVEISGIFEENQSNTLRARINKKHKQIEKGSKTGIDSSVVITLFSTPETVYETHHEAQVST